MTGLLNVCQILKSDSNIKIGFYFSLMIAIVCGLYFRPDREFYNQVATGYLLLS